ncbi:MAG: hypothetical protein BJ554DRAFT_1629, partial [Olpidium bornovanus]
MVRPAPAPLPRLERCPGQRVKLLELLQVRVLRADPAGVAVDEAHRPSPARSEQLEIVPAARRGPERAAPHLHPVVQRPCRRGRMRPDDVAQLESRP